MNTQNLYVNPLSHIDKRLYFLLLCLSYCLFVYLYQEFIYNDNLYFQAYSEQMSYERIEAIIQNNKNYVWLNYILTPLFLLLRIFLVSLCLFTGVLVADYKIRYIKVFQIALVAEGVYLIPTAIKVGWFLFFAQNYTLQDVNNFDFYSLLALVGREHLEVWWTYVLYCANLFELLYWLVLAYGFYLALSNAKVSYDDALWLVISSYGIGLLLWIIFVCFLLVNLS